MEKLLNVLRDGERGKKLPQKNKMKERNGDEVIPFYGRDSNEER